ncbi:unnamed protein product [Thelazia callipaeda]|uniref:Methyltranfer_dom domain-containing protein n=1 Tax=Thelazia callipaeda TaxID=103827 RepID=A0A0N5D2K1_THECL|nr:unnamed protein product [Thelazia callipaeda]
MSTGSLAGELLSCVLDFISKYNFLYDQPNIKFLSSELWRRIPSDWLMYLEKLSNDELNMFPFEKPKPHCPETLLNFHTLSNEVSYRLAAFCGTADNLLQLPGHHIVKVMRPMSAKKRHEVENFTVFLREYCKQYNINRIVDVGCGVLARYYKVVGIDCEEILCDRARKSCVYAEIVCLNMVKDDKEDQKLIEFFSGDQNDLTAIVSLHGCGDLQPMLLRLFCKLDRKRVPLLFTIPCCYHKMSDIKQEMFQWIMSDEMKQKSISCNVFPVSALRLASQKHISSWSCSEKDREKHKKGFIDRALLECLYDKRSGDDLISYNQFSSGKEGISDLRPLACRKLNRHFTALKNIGSQLASRLLMDETRALKVEQLWKEIYTNQEPYFTYVELLQTMIQIPMEMLVLLDRILFLMQYGCSADNGHLICDEEVFGKFVRKNSP